MGHNKTTCKKRKTRFGAGRWADYDLAYMVLPPFQGEDPRRRGYQPIEPWRTNVEGTRIVVVQVVGGDFANNGPYLVELVADHPLNEVFFFNGYWDIQPDGTKVWKWYTEEATSKQKWEDKWNYLFFDVPKTKLFTNYEDACMSGEQRTRCRDTQRQLALHGPGTPNNPGWPGLGAIPEKRRPLYRLDDFTAGRIPEAKQEVFHDDESEYDDG